MKDIARVVGVSVNTVSRALADKDDISDGTKQKILEAAKKLKYTKNHLAMGLRGKHTQTIAVIVPENSNPFFAEVIKGIEETVKARGYGLILCNTEQDPEQEKQAIELVLEKRVDGVIFSPAQGDKNILQQLQEHEKPFVLVARYFKNINVNYVVSDNLLGAFLITQHLIEQGHHRILMLNGTREPSSARDRLEGYKKALKANGLTFDDSIVRFGAMEAEDGYRMIKADLKKGRASLNFSAVFCFSDYVAVGVMKAFQEEGVAVPDDIAIAGYDDLFFSSVLCPPLTTMRIPKRELGRIGGNILLKLIKSKKSDPVIQRVLKPRLIVRGSSLKIRNR